MELQSHNSTKSSFICFKNPFLNHKVIKLLKNKLKPLCLKNIKNKNSSQTTATIAPPSYSLSPSFMSSRAKLTNNDLGLNYHILQEKVRRHIHENRLTEQRHSRKQSEDNDESGPLQKYKKLFEQMSEGKSKKNVKIIGKYKFQKNSQKQYCCVKKQCA